MLALLKRLFYEIKYFTRHRTGKEKPFTIKHRDINLKGYPGGAFMDVFYEVYLAEVYKPSKNIGRINTVIDLGAYIGDFSIWASKKYNPEKIVAVEPDPKLIKLLRENIKRNNIQKKISIYEKAILDENKSAALKRGRVDSMSSVTKAPSGNIQGITLNKLMDQENIEILDFLKIDIEGNEKFILTKENQNLFKERIKFVTMESHTLNGYEKNKAIEYFKSLGFNINKKFSRFRVTSQFEAYNPKLISDLK